MDIINKISDVLAADAVEQIKSWHGDHTDEYMYHSQSDTVEHGRDNRFFSASKCDICHAIVGGFDDKEIIRVTRVVDYELYQMLGLPE